MNGRKLYTLVINRSDSRCGHCGLGAFAEDTTHHRVAGWGPKNGSPGCGVRWVFVDTDYEGIDPTEARHDLVRWTP